MHRVVPELIIENYREGRYHGKFQAVGLFLDLYGFSVMTDSLMQHGQHGAEVLAGMMHSVFDPIVQGIFEYGGRIVSFAGDGILVLFPIDRDAKYTALSALASARITQERIDANPARQTVYGDFVFSIKVGLALGSVSWAILRSEDDRQATYYFRGTAVDKSARAEHIANAGEIVIDRDLYELLHDAIETKTLDGFHRFEDFQMEVPAPVALTPQPVDLGTSRIFMPEEVIVHDMRGEFRQIVNLFMRFPDLPDAELENFMEVVFDLRKRYGGLLNRLDFGDKGCNMLMLWGAPIAYENDIGRALNFVLELKEKVEFPITAGVTYYVAHAGYLGSELCEDYTCYGWGVNLASRFMMSASAGEVWVDERVARRMSRRFEFQYLGSQRFKGFAAEQKVNVLRARKREIDITYRGVMVGREKETRQLEEFVEPLWRGELAGVLGVVGDAGIGKSRLIREFIHSDLFEKHPSLWAICQADQILRQSFNPFRKWLFRYFGVSSLQIAADRKKAFDAILDDLLASIPNPVIARELDRTRSILGALVDVYWDDSLYSQLDAEGRYKNTFLALTALIKAESLRQPILLFLEDMQFIDQDSQAFLFHLKRSLSSGTSVFPVAVIISSRPAGMQPFLKESLLDQKLGVGSLSKGALAKLAEVYLEGPPSPELVDLLTARSEGNPYFAEQILIYLQEEHLLQMSEEGWVVNRQLRASNLPSDIRALLIARLDQLPRHVRDVILTASVMGREFDAQILAEMFKDEEFLGAEISEAQQADIWTEISRYRYIFTHGLLRDAAYSMQVRARRMELHARALTALEKTYGEETKYHYAELAHHAEFARLAEKALHYLRLAGKSAAEQYQNEQAVDFYTRALTFVASDDLLTQFDLRVERVKLYSHMSKRDLQLKDLDVLERLANQMEDADCIVKVQMLYSAYHFFIGDYQAAIDLAKKAEDCSESLSYSELGLYTRVVWSTALLHLGRLEEAMQYGQKTLEVSRRVGNRREQCRILNTMGWIALELNRPDDARNYLNEGLELALEINDLSMQARLLNHLAKLEGEANANYALAREYYEKAYQLHRETGELVMQGDVLHNMGFAAGMQGDFEAARAYYEQTLTLVREVENIHIEVFTLINLSAVMCIQKEVQTALSLAQQAVELSRKISERVSEGWATLYLGHTYLSLGEVEQAQKAYRESIDIRNELGQISLSMEPITGLAESYLQLDDLASAKREVEKILDFLSDGSQLNGTDEPLRVYYTCYLVLEKNKDPRASQILQTASEMLEKQLSNFKSEFERKRYVENIPWRRAINDLSKMRQS